MVIIMSFTMYLTMENFIHNDRCEYGDYNEFYNVSHNHDLYTCDYIVR